jgi:hypothetical protein
MKKGSTIFLQAVIALVGIGAFAFMLWEPQIEGRNVDATHFEVYFKDPFLAYVYIASIAFFMLLYQAFRLFAYIRQDKAFSIDSVRALRSIKRCAISLVGFIAGAEAYIVIFQRGKDDIAGGVAMGAFMIFVSVVIAATASVFEGLLQNKIDTKSDLSH